MCPVRPESAGLDSRLWGSCGVLWGLVGSCGGALLSGPGLADCLIAFLRRCFGGRAGAVAVAASPHGHGTSGHGGGHGGGGHRRSGSAGSIAAAREDEGAVPEGAVPEGAVPEGSLSNGSATAGYWSPVHAAANVDYLQQNWAEAPQIVMPPVVDTGRDEKPFEAWAGQLHATIADRLPASPEIALQQQRLYALQLDVGCELVTPPPARSHHHLRTTAISLPRSSTVQVIYRQAYCMEMVYMRRCSSRLVTGWRRLGWRSEASHRRSCWTCWTRRRRTMHATRGRR